MNERSLIEAMPGWAFCLLVLFLAAGSVLVAQVLL